MAATVSTNTGSWRLFACLIVFCTVSITNNLLYLTSKEHRLSILDPVVDDLPFRSESSHYKTGVVSQPHPAPIIAMKNRTTRTSYSPLELLKLNDDSLLLESLGIEPRRFSPWNKNTRLPCYRPEKDWQDLDKGKTPLKKGFLFVKSPKTGSSTGSGITLRIAHNIGRRHNYSTCKSRFHHSTGLHMKYAERNKKRSFLWSIVRDPTSRAISEFFHFRVSRNEVEPSDKNFIKFLKSEFLPDLQLRYLTLKKYEGMQRGKSMDGNYTMIVDAVNTILLDYDFIGVTERMDDSAVALQLLLGLETSDVMYLNRYVPLK